MNSSVPASLDVLDLIDRMLVYDHVITLLCRGSAWLSSQSMQPEAQRILPKEAMLHPYFAQIRVAVQHCKRVVRCPYARLHGQAEKHSLQESSPKAAAAASEMPKA